MTFGDLPGLIESWDGEAVITRYDHLSGTWIFIALHDATLGTPVGGTRMRIYARVEDGLEDALRLARGMTHKWASIDLPFGGAKAVLATSRSLSASEREGLLDRYAGLLNVLEGAFETGEDLGTTPEDMAFLADRSPYVMGRGVEGEALDPGPYTATGVFAGIRAAVRHAMGRESLEGVRVLIQGTGDVGAPLARMLAEAGADLILCDREAARVGPLAAALGARTVAPEKALTTPTDVLAPCAVGAVINADSIPGLQTRIVAGSANNQLAEDMDAIRLHERGILYAPDFIINAGGALAFGLMRLGTTTPAAIAARLEEIGAVMLSLFETAAATQTSPLEAANDRVEHVLARGPRPSEP